MIIVNAYNTTHHLAHGHPVSAFADGPSSSIVIIRADFGNLPFDRSFRDDFVACLDLNDLFVCNEERNYKKRKRIVSEPVPHLFERRSMMKRLRHFL